MNGEYDKVIVLRNNKSQKIIGVVIHDVADHSKKFFLTEETGMDELLELINLDNGIQTK